MRLLVGLLLLIVSPLPQEAPTGWTNWRGPLGSGASPDATPPAEIGEGVNVAWKVAIPGEGSGSPVVHGDTVYVSTAIPGQDEEYTFELLALDTADGSARWSRVAAVVEPHQGRQPTNTYASHSPIVDDERVYAYFGSRGLHVYTHAGDPVWSVDLGDMETRGAFGEGNTPALHGDTIVVVWDQETDSFIVALDAATGVERWRRTRDEPTTWATPLIVDAGGPVQVITPGTRRVRSYDLDTGDLVWEGPGLTLNAIPTPIYSGGILYLTSGFRGEALMAVDLAAARGVIDDTAAILWRHDEDTPYVPSPLLYGGGLYILKSNSALLTRLDARTGEVDYGPVRLPDMQTIYSSPVGADGRIYVFDRDGNAMILDPGPEFRVLAQSQFDDGFDATPALVGPDMYLRGQRSLYRLSS